MITSSTYGPETRDWVTSAITTEKTPNRFSDMLAHFKLFTVVIYSKSILFTLYLLCWNHTWDLHLHGSVITHPKWITSNWTKHVWTLVCCSFKAEQCLKSICLFLLNWESIFPSGPGVNHMTISNRAEKQEKGQKLGMLQPIHFCLLLPCAYFCSILLYFHPLRCI